LKKLTELKLNCRKATLQNFAWLITGIFHSRSVSTGRIALELGWETKTNSIIQRLRRTFMDSSIRVREWYRPIAKCLLETQAHILGQVRLILDGSKIGNSHQLLLVSIAFRGRAIPIAWTWIPYVKGHSSARVQKALLSYVKGLIPDGVAVIIVGDAEFGNVSVMQQVANWGWSYVFRQKSSSLVQLDGQSEWKPLGDYTGKEGQKQWLGQTKLTQTHSFSTNIYIEWRVGEKEVWFLATNLKTAFETKQAYSRRMWIEEMFGDLKSNGFDLERTKLQHFQRLSRLTLAVVLLYVWLLDLGTRVIKNGNRAWVDRKKRRDYSVFRIGYNTLKRLISSGKNLPEIRFRPCLN
jgi:Transposase DDE domain